MNFFSLISLKENSLDFRPDLSVPGCVLVYEYIAGMGVTVYVAIVEYHLAEHLPNAYFGDASEGSRSIRSMPSRDDPKFIDVYLLQCKLLPVAPLNNIPPHVKMFVSI